MLTAARLLEPEYVIDGPAGEVTGPDSMYVPTTQIRLTPDSPWHRRSAIATETACGISYGAAFVREYELTGELCPHCFTPREHHLAQHPDEIGRKPQDP